MGKVIGILSLKGGVGKTSITSGLGAALADFGKNVLLVDANFSAPNLGIHFNLIDPNETLHDVLSRSTNIGDAIYRVGNLDILPSSLFNRSQINPLKLKDHLKPLKKKYDYIVIDSSPSLGDETLAAMLASDDIFVVTTPDTPTLGTTLKAVKLAKQRKAPITGLILNKVHNKNFELSTEDIENTAEVPVMAVVPHDINVLRALSKFEPSTQYKPKSQGSVELKKLAATMIGEKYRPFQTKKLWGWINPPRQEINRTIFYRSSFD